MSKENFVPADWVRSTPEAVVRNILDREWQYLSLTFVQIFEWFVVRRRSTDRRIAASPEDQNAQLLNRKCSTGASAEIMQHDLVNIRASRETQ